MPHIKVKPFNSKALDNSSTLIEFRAISDDKKEIVLVSNGKNRLFLDIIRREKEVLIKPNKVTKGSDISLLKDFLNRFAKEFNLEVIHTNAIVKPTKPKIAHKYFKTIEDFYEFKSDFKQVKLEVGFGSARHLLYRAREERDTLFIGIEIHSASINQLLKHITLQELNNIWVLNYDGRLLLEMLPSNILDTIYVHFPVPWDKKPHRRVISDFFVKESIRTLKKGASLELRTDSKNYYEYSLEVFSRPKLSRFMVEKNIDIEVQSKYEERWRKMKKDIYTLTLESLEESVARELNIDFSFSKVKEDIEIPKEPILKDNYFVHFGKVYKRVDSKGFVVEISFGSFNMPEKKMIVVGDSCYYLPTNPVKSLVNFKAHNIIKEVLNG